MLPRLCPCAEKRGPVPRDGRERRRWLLRMGFGYGGWPWPWQAKMPLLSCFIVQWERSLPDRHANVAPTHWPSLDFLPSWQLIELHHVDIILVCSLL